MNESYYIIIADSIYNLEAKVQLSIHKGYKPIGGPFLWAPHICQAMILDQTEPET